MLLGSLLDWKADAENQRGLRLFAFRRQRSGLHHGKRGEGGGAASVVWTPEAPWGALGRPEAGLRKRATWQTSSQP